MKNKADYSKYKCPYSHLEKECGHELHGPEGFTESSGNKVYGVWCACGFRGPASYLDPENLRLEAVQAGDGAGIEDPGRKLENVRRP